MEARFKKFIRNRQRRSAVEADNSLVVRSLPYEATSPSTRQPIFLHQPLSKSASEARRDAEKLAAVPIRALSYDQVTPGKAPIFLQTLPEKGNGPVKLQATRQLSSGEIVTSIEDSQTALQEIRDGNEYIVGRKHRSMSNSQGSHRPSWAQTTASTPLTNDSPPVLDGFPTPPTTKTWPNSPEFDRYGVRLGSEARASTQSLNVGLGLPSLTSPTFVRPRQSTDSNLDRRSNASRPSLSQGSLRPGTITVHSTSATLEALRRAEYGKLVEMYGPDAAARNIARLDSEHLRQTYSPTATQQPHYTSIILEPLPAPPTEIRETDSRRASRVSGTSESFCDEWSGASSSQRTSCVSSYAESSNATAQTSLMEDDTTSTRDDIRNMVAQMRLNYLDALESIEKSAKPKARKKKQRKPKLMPSPTEGGTEGIRASHTHRPGRQSWHLEELNATSHPRRKTHSNPARDMGRLSPIEASPSRYDTTEDGLKRADSTTLGALMADLTREKIRSQAKDIGRSNSEHPVTPQKPPSTNNSSWLNLESDSADELSVKSPHHSSSSSNENHPPVVAHHSTANDPFTPNPTDETADFDTLYQDLFGKGADDIWSSCSQSPQLNRACPASWDTTKQTNTTISHSHIHTPPRRIITSIHESPEYTRLATTDKAEDNFI